MQNDFEHVNDVDRVLRDRNREIDIFVEKKVSNSRVDYESNKMLSFFSSFLR